MTAERRFANSVDSIARARRFAIDALDDIEPDVVDAIAVMVSELATNAVRHAASDFTVAIDRDDLRIRVAVSDAGDRLPSLRTPEPGEHSGRGLQIVRALADEWGVSERGNQLGKTVWFLLATSSPRHDGARSASAPTSTTTAKAATGGRPGPGPVTARPPSSPPRDARKRGPQSRARSKRSRRCHARVRADEKSAIRVQTRRDDGHA